MVHRQFLNPLKQFRVNTTHNLIIILIEFNEILLPVQNIVVVVLILLFFILQVNYVNIYIVLFQPNALKLLITY